MDLAGLQPLVHQPVVVAISTGTKFIGRLETIPESKTTVKLEPLDAATAAKDEFAINGVPALDIGSIVFVQRLPA
jgi:hypothetical protein